MKSRLLLLALILVGGTALVLGIVRPHVSTLPATVVDPLADLKPPPLPPPELPALVIPPTPSLTPPELPPRPTDAVGPAPEVPIQNGLTIDFSTGAPVLKSETRDQEALDSALKEIAEVAKRTQIQKPPPPPASQTK
jgi:hypothetical protein